MSEVVELVSGLRRRIGKALRSVVAGAEGFALLDFPGHPNVGDSAIWLGELAWLRSIGVRRLSYTADIGTFDAKDMARRVGGDTILLSGGGNFGDLWEHHQLLREAVVRALPDNPIVLMPQSIHFRRPESLARARAVFGAHGNLTLMLRDERSLETAEREFSNPCGLCPDMALFLGSSRRPRPARIPCLWLCRSDQESLAGVTRENAPGVHADWMREPRTRLDAWVQSASEHLAQKRRRLRRFRRPLSALYPRIARRRLAVGLRMLSEAHVVVTDRLHGHILCLLLGIPHVLMDNSYGKIRAFHDAWTSGASLAHWASSVTEAAEIADGLLTDMGS